MFVGFCQAFLHPLTTHLRQVLTKDEGGRYTPFMSNYRPQLFIRTTDVTVALTFPPGTEGADGALQSTREFGHELTLLYREIGHAGR